ncbi:hypothetical protein ALC56_09108 [Trachymyrmex septentrionalis]|uniref:Gustatory receptor n=1 Tax=Trachymyrmex septentrionalis TaxID=34720 RepID=A0A151JUR0_9HYME|nr:hypothetical protein ALC56_09108 [Trachymyrmex septentrionalis]
MFQILIFLIIFLSVTFSIHIVIKFLFKYYFLLCRIINQYDFLKELKLCLHELSLVDDTMEAIGLPKKYQRLRKWIIRITIGYIVYMFYRFAAHVLQFKFFYQTNINFDFICLMFSLYYPSFVHIACTVIWGTILGYVSFKFYQVNDRLHGLYSDLFENNADYRRQNRSNLVCQRITEAEDRKQYIWIIM